MLCGYFLSRFDEEAYRRLGYGTQKRTHEVLAEVLGVPHASIKAWRDEFDPIHENPRRGWLAREMVTSRRRMAEALAHLSFDQILAVVRDIAVEPDGAMPVDLAAALCSIESEGLEQERAYGLRGLTGLSAEEAFRQYHARHGEPRAGELRDCRNNQCGYDFEIATADGILAVEVKGLGGNDGGVTFTDKEWRTALEWGPAYFLALVRNASSEPRVSMISNPASTLRAKPRIYRVVQVDWAVSEANLRTQETTS
jgi:hypothetical protein